MYMCIVVAKTMTGMVDRVCVCVCVCVRVCGWEIGVQHIQTRLISSYSRFSVN